MFKFTLLQSASYFIWVRDVTTRDIFIKTWLVAMLYEKSLTCTSATQKTYLPKSEEG